MQLQCSLSPVLHFTVEAHQDTLLVCIRQRNHRSHPSKLQQGGTTGHTERNGYSPAAQRRKPASRSWTTGAEERPAWLSAQLCGEESSQRLSRGRGTPGHLQLSMLPPLLSLLRAPGSTLHCNVPLSPFKSTASLPPCLSVHKHCVPAPTLVCNHHVTGINHNSYHKLPFTCCGLASLSCFPLPEASPRRCCSETPAYGRNLRTQQLQPPPHTKALALQSGPPL